MILVPHGDLETRTLEVSYRKLKLILGGVATLVVGFIVMASFWWYMLAQVARLPGLERELRQLEVEREKVVELARTLQEVESQYERVRQLLGAEASGPDRRPLLPPLRPEATTGPSEAEPTARGPENWPLTLAGYITRSLTGGDREAHPGLDIAVPQDSYIRAAGGGVVAAAGTDTIYGRYVLLRHEDGYETMYGHASRVFVSVGDTVEAREVLALSGSTGRSTGPHLHFEVRMDGEPVDPLPVVRRPGG